MNSALLYGGYRMLLMNICSTIFSMVLVLMTFLIRLAFCIVSRSFCIQLFFVIRAFPLRVTSCVYLPCKRLQCLEPLLRDDSSRSCRIRSSEKLSTGSSPGSSCSPLSSRGVQESGPQEGDDPPLQAVSPSY